MRRFAPQAIDRERSVEAVSAEKSFDSEFGRSADCLPRPAAHGRLSTPSRTACREYSRILHRELIPLLDLGLAARLLSENPL